MRIRRRAVTAAALSALISASIFLADLRASQAPPALECRDRDECRQLALEAAGQRAYERFHDLAWRTVQRGRPNDPELLYLLARAQSLSNRPHDALVVLRRLADMGMVYDALTHEDFRLARLLPGWAAFEAQVGRQANAREASSPAAALPAAATPAAPPVRRADAPVPVAIPAPAPAPPPAPPARPSIATPPSATAGPRVLAIEPLSLEQAARFSVDRFIPGGLAYDAVSQRFVLGSGAARKLIVVDPRTNMPVDLVRAEAAGFGTVTAVEIDDRRGDLWVLSEPGVGTLPTLHRLQLISGRSLARFDIGSPSSPASAVDLGVTRSGTVLVLDDMGRQVLALPPRGQRLDRVARLDTQMPISLAVTDDESVAYVATQDALVKVDLKGGRGAAVTIPNDITLGTLHRIRWHGRSLIVVASSKEGAGRILRLQLNRNGTAVTSATILDESLGTGVAPTFATIRGNDLYYLATSASPREAGPPAPGDADVRVQRLQLR